MAEKKRADLVKIEVYDEDDWLHVNIAAKTEEMRKMLEDLLGDLIPGLPGGDKKLKNLKIHPGEFIAFAAQLPLPMLEKVVKDLNMLLEQRKHPKSP